MILVRAGWLTGTGVCNGLLLAFGLAHGVANLLFEVRPTIRLIFGTHYGAITGVALLQLASCQRRAKFDPMIALRDE